MYFVVAHGFFCIELMTIGIADASDAMQSIKELIVIQQVFVLANFKVDQHPVIRIISAFRVVNDHAKRIFHYDSGIINRVSKLSALQLPVSFIETVPQLLNVVGVVLAAVSCPVKTRSIVSIPTVALPVITFAVEAIDAETVTAVAFCIPSKAVKTVYIETITIVAAFVSARAIIPVGVEALTVVSINIEPETVETFAIVPG